MEDEFILRKLTEITVTINEIDNKEDEDLTQIYNSIKKYINKHCKHNIISDYIDITPDYGQTIKYCDKCWQTFNF
jgi:uncharacterized protein YozE (UPF0346 family)